jgi:hypothetical protein
VNYKELFNKVSLLISSPAKAWEEISLEEDRRGVLEQFVYPMIGLCALSVFIGSLMTNGLEPDTLQIAVRSCCIEAAALFGGYFLAAYIIDRARVMICDEASDVLLVRQFAGYAMVAVFLILIFEGLFPDLALIGWIFRFYTIYIVWEGMPVVLHVSDNQRLKLTLYSSLSLLLCPLVIQIVFNKMLSIIN